MNKNPFEKLSSFSFHDGHPKYFSWDGCDAILEYENWQERLYRLVFKKVAYIQGLGGGASLCDATITNDTEKISQDIEALNYDWATDGTWNVDKLIKLTIFDDIPILVIIFEDVEIVEIERKR